MTRRRFLRQAGTAGLVAAAAPALLRARSLPTGPRPNVLVLLTDDQGYGDLGCHGNPALRTPHLDQLHAESVRLTDFHVAPMCTPTRGQLLTGQDALRNGALATCLGRNQLRTGLPTTADLFREHGYATGLFGKWHLGSSYPHRPMDRGFEECVYHQGYGLTGIEDRWNNDYLDPWYRHNGVEKRAKGYCTDFWFDQAMAWMGHSADAGRPFFCYLATNVPHFPKWVSDKYAAPYAGLNAEHPELADFFGMIANLDENVGRMEQFLRARGLRDNTIVVFATDNGGTGGVRFFNAGMRGGKCQLTEGGHRVPCFLRWPAGGLRAPGDLGLLAQAQDLTPTLLDLCGLPPGPTASFDGSSLAPVLRGADPSPALADRALVVQIYHWRLQRQEAAVMWRRWRLVQGDQLYDLARDPGQEHNRLAEEPEVARRLQEHYDRWWDGVEPGLAELVPNHLGSAVEPEVMLHAGQWQDVRADGADSVRQAVGPTTGAPWQVLVERAGLYEVELRRWPREADLALDAGAPAFQPAAGQPLAEGRALPIRSARLQAAGQTLFTFVEPGEKAARLQVRLPQGRGTLQACFCGARTDPVCGAYFAYVRRM